MAWTSERSGGFAQPLPNDASILVKDCSESEFIGAHPYRNASFKSYSCITVCQEELQEEEIEGEEEEKTEEADICTASASEIGGQPKEQGRFDRRDENEENEEE